MVGRAAQRPRDDCSAVRIVYEGRPDSVRVGDSSSRSFGNSVGWPPGAPLLARTAKSEREELAVPEKAMEAAFRYPSHYLPQEHSRNQFARQPADVNLLSPTQVIFNGAPDRGDGLLGGGGPPPGGHHRDPGGSGEAYRARGDRCSHPGLRSTGTQPCANGPAPRRRVLGNRKDEGRNAAATVQKLGIAGRREAARAPELRWPGTRSPRSPCVAPHSARVNDSSAPRPRGRAVRSSARTSRHMRPPRLPTTRPRTPPFGTNTGRKNRSTKSLDRPAAENRNHSAVRGGGLEPPWLLTASTSS